MSIDASQKVWVTAPDEDTARAIALEAPLTEGRLEVIDVFVVDVTRTT